MEEYVPIRVNTLRGDQKITFDAYIKINDKMVHYLRRGDSFEGARLDRLKSKKLKKMFIIPGDEANYRSYLEKNIEIAYDDKSGKDIKTRGEIIQGDQQANVDEVFENPEKAEAYNVAKDSASRYVQFLLQHDPGAVASILQIENTERSISHHGVSTATLAVALANKLGMADPKMIQLMGLGALLHDFGHQESGQDVTKKIKEFTPDEFALYKRHPTVGSSRVQDKKHFDQMVLNIIAQHEECIDGSGFPKGLKEKDMDPAIVIVSSANALDRMISLEGVPRAEAPKRLMIEQVGRHPLNHIQALAAILKNV